MSSSQATNSFERDWGAGEEVEVLVRTSLRSAHSRSQTACCSPLTVGARCLTLAFWKTKHPHWMICSPSTPKRLSMLQAGTMKKTQTVSAFDLFPPKRDRLLSSFDYFMKSPSSKGETCEQSQTCASSISRIVPSAVGDGGGEGI